MRDRQSGEGEPKGPCPDLTGEITGKLHLSRISSSARPSVFDKILSRKVFQFFVRTKGMTFFKA